MTNLLIEITILIIVVILVIILIFPSLLFHTTTKHISNTITSSTNTIKLKNITTNTSNALTSFNETYVKTSNNLVKINNTNYAFENITYLMNKNSLNLIKNNSIVNVIAYVIPMNKYFNINSQMIIEGTNQFAYVSGDKFPSNQIAIYNKSYQIYEAYPIKTTNLKYKITKIGSSYVFSFVKGFFQQEVNLFDFNITNNFIDIPAKFVYNNITYNIYNYNYSKEVNNINAISFAQASFITFSINNFPTNTWSIYIKNNTSNWKLITSLKNIIHTCNSPICSNYAYSSNETSIIIPSGTYYLEAINVTKTLNYSAPTTNHYGYSINWTTNNSNVILTNPNQLTTKLIVTNNTEADISLNYATYELVCVSSTSVASGNPFSPNITITCNQYSIQEIETQ
ncbi:MAG: hypothetical protein QXU98_05555 [Candidatus Parvarchaeota archaeon]